MKLSELSKEELFNLKREIDKEEEKRMRLELVDGRPKVIENPDWSGLIEQTEEIIEERINGDWHEDNDNDVYISEQVFKTIYGRDFYNWWNKLD